VPHSYFAESPLPLPPLAEQKRIVAKVDELMGLCDRLEALEAGRKDRHASLSRAALARFAAAPTPTNLQLLFHNSFDVEPGDIRQSILALAIRGKLVSQQSEDKPLEPEVTLDRQQAFDIPTNWVWTNLKGIGTCHTGKTPPTNNPLNYGTGFPFIGPGQITPTGKLITSEKMLTKAGLENTTIGNPGDILMVCIGGSIGKAVACQETIGFNQQINSIRVSKSLPEFILLVLVSSYFQNEVVSRASGSATPIINKGKWEQIPIPIPPLAEQKRIVAKVDELMALVDQLEQQLANSRTLGQQLLEAVVEHLTNSKAQTEAIT
jgi:type I restriction enzyme S subunit